MKSHNTQQGSILLTLTLLMFAVSLSLALWISYRLWSANNPDKMYTEQLSTTDPAPEESAPVSLEPALRLEDELATSRDDLLRQLVLPLRQYYATRPERLDSISIAAADEPYFATVTLNVATEGTQTEQSFNYGSVEQGKKQLPKWEPGMLSEK